MKKLIFMLAIFYSSLVADNSFKDIDYIIDKSIIRETAERLEILKNNFTEHSSEYVSLHEAQQILLSKLPLDSFGTYSRIKLHNIIDRSVDNNNFNLAKNNVLTPGTDLNRMYEEKLRLKEEMEKIQKGQGKTVDSEAIESSNPFARYYKGKGGKK